MRTSAAEQRQPAARTRPAACAERAPADLFDEAHVGTDGPAARVAHQQAGQSRTGVVVVADRDARGDDLHAAVEQLGAVELDRDQVGLDAAAEVRDHDGVDDALPHVLHQAVDMLRSS